MISNILKMSTNHFPNSASVKECGRIFCTTFLSLVPALLLLLFARLSGALHQTPDQPHFNNLNAISTYLHTKTTSALGFLILAAAISALAQIFAGDKNAWLISGRRLLQRAVVWVFSIQVCLSLWVYGFVEIDGRIDGGGAGGLVFVRSLVLGLGLHETVVFWRRNVANPAVEEVVSGIRREGFGWAENVLLTAAFGCLWWRRLRGEAEEMVVIRRDAGVVDVVGWLLYGSTVAVGGVRVVKGILWVVNRIFRRHPQVNGNIRVVDHSLGLDLKIKVEKPV